MKIGIIGFGSIGRRHAQNLIQLGFEDICLLRLEGKGNPLRCRELYDEDEFFRQKFDVVIVSTVTSEHFRFVDRLLSQHTNLLVEKPLVHLQSELDALLPKLESYKGIGSCAFNLRFHPAVIKVREWLETDRLGKVYSARFFVGQYLPDWKPDTDYRQSYSAIKSSGGGVVLDLIHEIDLAGSLFGGVKDSFHAIVDRVSDLQIETEDLAEIHYRSENSVIVSIHLDYLTQGYARHFEFIGEKASARCDLFEPLLTLTGSGNDVIERVEFKSFERNQMYLDMMKHFTSCIQTRSQPFPTLLESAIPMQTALKAKSFWKAP